MYVCINLLWSTGHRLSLTPLSAIFPYSRAVLFTLLRLFTYPGFLVTFTNPIHSKLSVDWIPSVRLSRARVAVILFPFVGSLIARFGNVILSWQRPNWMINILLSTNLTMRLLCALCIHSLSKTYAMFWFLPSCNNYNAPKKFWVLFQRFNGLIFVVTFITESLIKCLRNIRQAVELILGPSSKIAG